MPFAIAHQHIRKAGAFLVIMEHVPLAGPAHVRIDEQHLSLAHGAGNGQVGGDGGLALARYGAGDHHRTVLLAHQGVKQVHAQLGVTLDRLLTLK